MEYYIINAGKSLNILTKGDIVKISGYTTDRKNKIVSVDKKIYSGDRKRYAVNFYQVDRTDKIIPIWKEFDQEQEAIEYINAIEKLI